MPAFFSHCLHSLTGGHIARAFKKGHDRGYSMRILGSAYCTDNTGKIPLAHVTIEPKGIRIQTSIRHCRVRWWHYVFSCQSRLSIYCPTISVRVNMAPAFNTVPVPPSRLRGSKTKCMDEERLAGFYFDPHGWDAFSAPDRSTASCEKILRQSEFNM